MISKNILVMLDQMGSMSQSETQLEAVHDLHDELDKSAKHQACLRCDKSGWTTIFDNRSKDKQKHRWLIVQTACGAFRSLPQNDAVGFGFSLASDPDTIYHCDAEAAGVVVGADESELRSRGRWPGTTGTSEAEREQALASLRRDRDADRG